MANLPASHFKLRVEGGWITLTGEVDWDYQRQVAASAVGQLMGVTGVSDRITVEPTISSSAVRSDIEAALKRRAKAESQRVFVDVKGADVTLTGSVHSWSERELATQTAWGTRGVRTVVNELTIVH
jgi:osmotically-inducible protein OsmY